MKSVTFHVADQKGSVTLKVYNGGDDAEGANTKYNLTGSEEYTIEKASRSHIAWQGEQNPPSTDHEKHCSLTKVISCFL